MSTQSSAAPPSRTSRAGSQPCSDTERPASSSLAFPVRTDHAVRRTTWDCRKGAGWVSICQSHVVRPSPPPLSPRNGAAAPPLCRRNVLEDVLQRLQRHKRHDPPRAPPAPAPRAAPPPVATELGPARRAPPPWPAATSSVRPPLAATQLSCFRLLRRRVLSPLAATAAVLPPPSRRRRRQNNWPAPPPSPAADPQPRRRRRRRPPPPPPPGIRAPSRPAAAALPPPPVASQAALRRRSRPSSAQPPMRHRPELRRDEDRSCAHLPRSLRCCPLALRRTAPCARATVRAASDCF